jgi:hypothetical protein
MITRRAMPELRRRAMPKLRVPCQSFDAELRDYPVFKLEKLWN